MKGIGLDEKIGAATADGIWGWYSTHDYIVLDFAAMKMRKKPNVVVFDWSCWQLMIVRLTRKFLIALILCFSIQRRYATYLTACTSTYVLLAILNTYPNTVVPLVILQPIVLLHIVWYYFMNTTSWYNNIVISQPFLHFDY